jgi:hypothetical protein
MKLMRFVLALALGATVGCGGTKAPAPVPVAPPPPTPIQASHDESRFGPLEVGADYQTYRRVTDEPFLSRVHGNRWVHVWVSEPGADAYLDGSSDIPVGTTVVKESWENDGGKPSQVAGPIYVMRKEAPGWWPEHEDWYYAIHWAEPTPEQRKTLGGPIYWRGHSPRAAYCWECHDNYYRSLGGLTPSSVIPR